MDGPTSPAREPPNEGPSAPAALARPGAWRQLKDSLAGVHSPGAIATVVACSLLIMAHHQGNTAFFRNALAAYFPAGPLSEVYPYFYWFGASLFFYLLLPVGAAAATPGIRVRDTGIGLGDRRFGFKATAVILAAFLPVVFLASRHPAFASHYPLCGAAKKSLDAFLLYELAYACYFVAWEYLYRGYLLFSLEPAMGRLAAFASMMPFAIAHYGKPQAETFGSVVAGIVLGLLALRARSFWYGAIIHAAVAVTMDVLASWSSL